MATRHYSDFSSLVQDRGGCRVGTPAKQVGGVENGRIQIDPFNLF